MGAKIKLLIAEDEDVIRNGMAKYIQLHTDRFENIYLASNGQEASDLIFKYQPELMLLDVQMPLKSGIEVMREAKRAGILPATIILSGYDVFSYAQQALRFGAKEYLLKPCRSTDILKKLMEVSDECLGEHTVEEEQSHKEKNSQVEYAKQYIEEHYFENLTLMDVADVVGIAAGYLSTLFSQKLSCGFVDYLNRVRIEHACTYLTQNYFKTYEIAYKVGFSDEKYFSKVFRKLQGQTPSEYRKKNI